ncbi:MAG: dihydroneopterin aldolase [Caulobacteraceae bacterium]
MTLHIANSELSLYHVFIRDLEVQATIGVYEDERAADQRVRVNIDLAVAEGPAAMSAPSPRADADCLDNVVDYGAIAARIRSLVIEGRSRLLETLAARIADTCLEDVRVYSARVRVEKPDVFTDAESAGIEIERHRRLVRM